MLVCAVYVAEQNVNVLSCYVYQWLHFTHKLKNPVGKSQKKPEVNDISQEHKHRQGHTLRYS